MASGNLRLCILKSLEKEPASGYGIMKQISELTGHKPSAGSLYPIMAELTTHKLVTRNKDEHYALTAEGKKQLTKELNELSSLIDEMVRHAKLFDHLTDARISPMIEETMSKLKRGERPFAGVEDDLFEFRSALVHLLRQNKVQNNKAAIKKIISRAKKELEALP